jgi:hypothetical protein
MMSAFPVLSGAPGRGGVGRFRAILRDFAAVVRAARETERLLGCSDAELERRGLRRSELVSHIFGSYLDGR